MKLLTNKTCKIIGLGTIGEEVVSYIANNANSLFINHQKQNTEYDARYIPNEVNTVEDLQILLKQSHDIDNKRFNFIIVDVDDSSAIGLFENVATIMVEGCSILGIATTIGIVLNSYENEIPRCISSKTNLTIEVCQTDVNLYNGSYIEQMAIPIGALYNVCNVHSLICIDYDYVREHLCAVKILRVVVADLDTISERRIAQLKQIISTSKLSFTYIHFEGIRTMDEFGTTLDIFFSDSLYENHSYDIVDGVMGIPSRLTMLYHPILQDK